MQAYGFDESNAGKPIPLPPPDGQAASNGRSKEALVPRDSGHGQHRPRPAAVSAAPNVMALVNALRRRWQLALVLGLLLGVVVGFATWFFRPVTFRAHTVLIVSSTEPSLLGRQEGRAEFSNYQRNQLAFIRSRPVLNAALRDPKVAALAIIREQVEPIEWLEKRIRAEFYAPEHLRIFLNGENPKELLPIVDAVCNAYLEEIVLKESQAKYTRVAKLRELLLYKEELMRGKRKTLRQMVEAGGPAGEKQGGLRQEVKEQYIKSLQSDVVAERRKLTHAQLELRTIEALEKKKGGKLDIPAESLTALVNKDPVVEKNRQMIAKLEEQLETNKARARDPENNPQIKSAAASIEALKKALGTREQKLRPEMEQTLQRLYRQDLGNQRMVAEAKVDFFAKSEQLLNENLNKALEATRKFGSQVIDAKFIEDDIAREDEFSKDLARQKTTLEVEQQAPPRIRRYEDPTAIPITTEANRISFGFMAGFATLFAVIFGVAFLESKARRVSHVEDVTQGLKIHLMGSIPNVPKRALAGSSAPRDVYWQNRLTESVDAIRTTLMNAAKFEGLRVVMVTSAVGGEGKTLLACHLAASLARAGLKTLLIDGDLRRPSVHRLFGLPLPQGLAELLQNEIDPAAATHTGLMDGLAVISAGQRDARASQALAGPRIREVLDQLRGSYDFIIVDSAPVLPVADSQLIGQHADGVVFSIMRDVSRLPQVYAAYERLSVLRIRTLGAVVNGISGGTYGAGDYYYIASAPESTSAAQ